MYLLIFMAGAFFGSVAANLPQRLFLQGPFRLSKAELLESNPNLRWVTLTFPIVYALAVVPVAFAFFGLFWKSFYAHPRAFVFFFPAIFIAGINLSSAIYEIGANVSPAAERNRAVYIVDPNATKCGVARIISFGAIVVAAFYLCWMRE